MENPFALTTLALLVIIFSYIVHRILTKRKLFNKVVSNAKSRAVKTIREAKAKAYEIDQDIERRIEDINARESASEARIERLKEADKEIRARLKESRALIVRIRHFPITNSGLSITPILIHPITGIMACPISSCGRPQSATGIYLIVCCFLIDSPVRVIR